MSAEQERYYMASQWRMMWWKFLRHRVAVASGVILLVMYASIFIVEWLSPYNLHSRDVDHIYAPPQAVHLFHEGEFVGPFVYGYSYRLNMDNLKREYTPDPAQVQPIRFFCHGAPYKFWSLWEGDLHVVCPAVAGTKFLAGTDRRSEEHTSELQTLISISYAVFVLKKK